MYDIKFQSHLLKINSNLLEKNSFTNVIETLKFNIPVPLPLKHILVLST